MRLHDWQLRLEALTDERLKGRFSFGEFDCCMFAADVVFAVTGRDPADGIRGTYSDESGAAEVIKAHGGVEAIGDARFGSVINPLQAQSGDVGLIETESGPALVAWLGSAWFGAGPWGLVLVDSGAVRKAWRCEV